MRILVAVATRHGATREIAENIAAAVDSALTDAAVRSQVEIRDAGLVRSVEGFDAVVLGSAVYMGHWLEPARKLAESFSDELRRVPVWLFSSGPVGEQESGRPKSRSWSRISWSGSGSVTTGCSAGKSTAMRCTSRNAPL
jgi:menaquinone-dependent protoporphyrinogen oxidase